MLERVDVIVVGAGVVGALVARELSRYKVTVRVIEAEPEVCAGASGRNSATIHSGHSVEPGTAKARLSGIGASKWRVLAEELQVPLIKTGDFVVAFDELEEQSLAKLLERGERNGVTELEIISGQALRKRIPQVATTARAALWCAKSQICDPCAATVAVMESAIENGAELSLQTEFRDFVRENGRLTGVVTNIGAHHCDWVVNCAGINSDTVMHRAGVNLDFRIVPRQGDYVLLDGAKCLVRGLLAPVPSALTKGIAVKATTDGDVLIGAQAQSVASRNTPSVSEAGLNEIWSGARRLVPNLERSHAVACFAGLRASGFWKAPIDVNEKSCDFLIAPAGNSLNLVNVAGIDSPGLTAAPAIAEQVVQLLREMGLAFEEKPNFVPSLGAAALTRAATRLQRVKQRRNCQVPPWFRPSDV